ncbi:MAG: hypothetical protein Q8P41_09625 [Pseudomonadota bacterium]|nr:hypothetical protein [Pseudomonadota bacterium]
MPDPVVRAHLLHVVTTLRSAPAAALDPDQRRARDAALDALAAYAHAGRFPRPDGPVAPRTRRIRPPRAFRGPGVRAPIFEDSAGTRCAVGHLLGLTRPDLVARIRDADNGVHLPEIDLPELDAWARASGFTRDELAWVQPGYCWEVPECDEVVLEAPPAHEQVCTGPDASLQGASSWYTDCQECGGTYKVWAWVTNAGTEAASGVTVSLGSGDQTIDIVEDVTVPAGQVVAVGPLETGSVRDLAAGGWLQVTAAGDCWGDWDRLESWGSPNGGPGYVEPAECGNESCGDTGALVDPDDSGDPDANGNPTNPTSKGGCGGIAAGVLLGVAMTGAGARRRRAE